MVALCAGNTQWQTYTDWGNYPSELVLQTDGNCVIYNSKNQPLWSTNTGGALLVR